MSVTLVVAEKPSVGREIAKVLGLPGRGSGCISGPGWVVTWAVGHFIGIAEPGDQDPAWAGRWHMRMLPMVPARFRLAVLPESARQYEVVRGPCCSTRQEEAPGAVQGASLLAGRLLCA